MKGDLGFYIVGYGCTTCIRNLGGLDDLIVATIDENDITASAVSSALAGTVVIDFEKDPIEIGKDEYTNELIRLVESEETISGTIRMLARHALESQLAAYSSSHERARIRSGSSISFAGGQMEYSSDEESEFSDSEIAEYKEKPYQLLRNGPYKVKFPNDILRCSSCAGKKKQDYKYKELLQHASGVRKGSSNRSAKDKANHLVLAMYLENELADEAEQSGRWVAPTPAAPNSDENDMYCWPWTAIVVNVVDEPKGDKDVQST